MTVEVFIGVVVIFLTGLFIGIGWCHNVWVDAVTAWLHRRSGQRKPVEVCGQCNSYSAGMCHESKPPHPVNAFDGAGECSKHYPLKREENDNE